VPEEKDGSQKRGILTRVGAVVSIVAGLMGIVTAAVALWPEGGDEGDAGPGTGSIKLTHSGQKVASELANAPAVRKKCPGIEKQPHYSVRLPLATATVALAATTGGTGRQGPRYATPRIPRSRIEPRGTRATIDGLSVERLARRARVSPERIEDLLWNAPPGPHEDISTTQVQTIINGTRRGYPSGQAPRDEAPEQPDSGGTGATGPSGPTEPVAPYETPKLDEALPEQQAPPGEGVAAEVAQAKGPTSEPMFWIIDVTAVMKRLGGRCGYVHWSVYDPRKSRHVAQSWLVDKRGLAFVSRGESDRQSGQFTIPVPLPPGPYTLRAAFYDAEATQLDAKTAHGLR
jgi:hypothetical protein